MKPLLVAFAASYLAGNALGQGVPECRSPGGRIAIPEEWKTLEEEAVPDLAGIDWRSAPYEDGAYALVDGRTFTDAAPIDPPAPDFPPAAFARKQEGICLSRFSVQADGHTSGILVFCNDPVFLTEAQTAIENARFDPARIDAVPVVRNKIIYPFYFCLNH